MLIGRKTFGLGGASLAALLVCANPAQAVIVVDASGQVTGGQAFYAKETVAGTATVGGETWYVATVPASGAGSARLTLAHPFARRLVAGQSATITYTLTNMQFHGSDAPALMVTEDGSSAAVTATLASGGQPGDDDAVFTVAADSTSGTIDTTRTLRLVIRGLRVDPATVGNIRVQVNKESQTVSRPDWSLSGVVRVRKVGILRESVSPVSAVAAFGTGFRSFVLGDSVRSDRLAASVGSLSFKVREDGTHHDASNGRAVTMLSQLFASGAITFRGDFSFASGVFLSTEPDCSATGADRIGLNGDANSRAATVDDANGKHLCIEVSGTTQIPEVSGYTASVDYTGVTNAAEAPGDVSLSLGGIGMGGSVVNIPYVTLYTIAYNHRLQVYNRSNEAAAYRIDFLPPAGTTANPPTVEGSFPPGNTSLLIPSLTTLTGRSRTALTLSVDVPPDLLQVQTILLTKSNGSTDTVVYTPE